MMSGRARLSRVGSAGWGSAGGSREGPGARGRPGVLGAGGDGPSVTAAVTGATTITGTVHGIGGIKVGNEVSAQITGTASHLTATAIQDPPADNSGTS